MGRVYVRLKGHERFNRSLVAILSHSRRPALQVMEGQARGIVGKVIGVTPPSGKKKGLAARKSGERTVEGNIRKVLVGVPVATNRAQVHGLTENDIAHHHESNRVAGQVKGRNRKIRRMIAPNNMLNRYVRRRQKAVGMLGAGWNAAASRFRVSPRDWPGFVRRHNPPSQASVRVTETKIRIRFENRVRFAGGVGVMPRRLKWALGKQASANEKIIAAYKGAARRAGFRVI